MYIVAIEILLFWIAFILGVYQEHLRDVVRGLWRSRRKPSDWWWIMKGMWKSKTFFAIGIMIALSFGIVFMNIAQEKTDEENMERIINDAIKANNERQNQITQDLIGRIDKVLEQNAEILARLEAQNVTGNTTNK